MAVSLGERHGDAGCTGLSAEGVRKKTASIDATDTEEGAYLSLS